MLELERAVVGTKQVQRAMQQGALECVYIAEDVEPFLYEKLHNAAKENDIPVKLVPTMKELGASCKIGVGAACAGILK